MLNNKIVKLFVNLDLIPWTNPDHKVHVKRYYHFFSRQDVDLLLEKIKNITIEQIFLDSNNWFIKLRKIT